MVCHVHRRRRVLGCDLSIGGAAVKAVLVHRGGYAQLERVPGSHVFDVEEYSDNQFAIDGAALRAAGAGENFESGRRYLFERADLQVLEPGCEFNGE